MFHYLIALKRVLVTDEGKAHDLYQTTSELLETKTSGQFTFVVDSIKAKFGIRPKKLEAIRCITKLASATTSFNSGEPLFPDYLVRSFDILIDALNTDWEGVGVAVFSAFETLVRTYPNSDVISQKADAIQKGCLKVLQTKAPEGNEEKEHLYSGLHLSALDITQLLFKETQIAPKLSSYAQDLAKLLKDTVKTSIGKVEENFKTLVADEILSLADKKWDGPKVEDVTEAEEAKEKAAASAEAATDTTPEAPASTTGVAFPKFDFTGAGASTTASTTTTPAFQFPKFAFGGATEGATTAGDAPQMAFPTFDWSALAKGAAENAEIESDEDDFTGGSGRGGRGRGARGGARGGRGRGRGRIEDSDSEDFSDSDIDQDWDSDDSDFDGDDGEGDEMEEQSSLCISALDTLYAVAKSLEGEQREVLREAIKEGISACISLKKMTDLGDIVTKIQTNLESL